MLCKAPHCAVNALMFKESVFLRSCIKQKMIKLFINKITASLLKYRAHLEMGLINKQKLPMFSSPRFMYFFSFSMRLEWHPSFHHYAMSFNI